jgi:hypothetical protein
LTELLEKRKMLKHVWTALSSAVSWTSHEGAVMSVLADTKQAQTASTMSLISSVWLFGSSSAPRSSLCAISFCTQSSAVSTTLGLGLSSASLKGAQCGSALTRLLASLSAASSSPGAFHRAGDRSAAAWVGARARHAPSPT